MSFGKNLQYLRKMRRNMTQEALAEALQVSRQTVSKWELDAAYPEINKLIEICGLFNCSLDSLLRSDMNICDEAYSNMRVEVVDAFRYVQYAVISGEPEDDAISHVTKFAKSCGAKQPQVIGWDFPFLSQEQVNVYHMHGYAAAWILPEDAKLPEEAEISSQDKQKYAVITIKDCFDSPFYTIPNAYKTLMSYMDINGLEHMDSKDVICCFEKSYEIDGREYMDVYIAVK